MKKTQNALKISTLDLYEKIDELDERLKTDKVFLCACKSEFLSSKNNRNTKTDKRYVLIYEILNKQFDVPPISKTNIWRYLKVKENSKTLYKDILSGEQSIRSAYDMMTMKKSNNVAIQKEKAYILKNNASIEEMDNMLKEISKQLQEISPNNVAYPTSKIQNMSSNIYEIRKKISEILSKRIIEETDDT